MNVKKSNVDLLREKAIHRYIIALDEGDMEEVAEIVEMTLDDPELERIITEINLAYHEEEQLDPIVTDAQVVRDLIHQHLHSAFINQEQPQLLDGEILQAQEKSLTIGDVAKRLQETNCVSSKEQNTLQHFLASSLPLPTILNMQAVRQLAAQLKIEASDRFLDLFRNTAIKLSIGRSHSQALQAAREQRGHYKTPSKPIQKSPKSEDKR